MAMRRPTWRAVFLVVGISALLISILLPTLDRLRDPYRTSGRQPCPSRLRHISQALLLYSMDHNGVYPTTLDALVTPDMLTSEGLTCYYTHKPFIFLAPGGVANSYGDEDLIVYEPLEAHDGEGSNLLFGSGRVAWEEAPAVRRYIARAATRPSTQATRPSN